MQRSWTISSLILLCANSCIAWLPKRIATSSPNIQSTVPQPTAKKVFQQKLDHTNLQDVRTFDQRYFIYQKNFREGGPLFFYTGNEGPLEEFYNNTGLPFDWAEEFGALIVFAEHRYYGQSLPFGDASFNKTNLGYLSVSQVLADFAMLATHLKEEWRISRVVAFGGSYGGMLSAWVRIKYPNVFDMSLAASAPLIQAVNLVEEKGIFYRLVTEAAAEADKACPAAVRAGFAAVLENAKTDAGLQKITKSFNLCKALDNNSLEHFILYARNAWTEMAMCNYPYPSSFLAPLPAWPIHAACEKVLQATDTMQGLADATAMPYKTDQACLDIDTLYVKCADQTGCGVGAAANAWDYQMCTEIFYEQETNNVTDMFPSQKWTMKELREYCQKHYGVVPDVAFARIHLGGTNMKQVASKIIFSNGRLDPWYGGGFTTDQGQLLPAVVVHSGAHHLDLRSASESDPQDVIDARLKEKNYIKQWLSDSEICPGPAAPLSQVAGYV